MLSNRDVFIDMEKLEKLYKEDKDFRDLYMFENFFQENKRGEDGKFKRERIPLEEYLNDINYNGYYKIYGYDGLMGFQYLDKILYLGEYRDVKYTFAKNEYADIEDLETNVDGSNDIIDIYKDILNAKGKKYVNEDDDKCEDVSLNMVYEKLTPEEKLWFENDCGKGLGYRDVIIIFREEHEHLFYVTCNVGTKEDFERKRDDYYKDKIIDNKDLQTDIYNAGFDLIVDFETCREERRLYKERYGQSPFRIYNEVNRRNYECLLKNIDDISKLFKRLIRCHHTSTGYFYSTKREPFCGCKR
jgi:hypothetical protein